MVSKFGVVHGMINIYAEIVRSAKQNERKITYILLCKDIVSKLIFGSPTENKKAPAIINAFGNIIEKIRQKQKLIPSSSLNEQLIFISDFGQEFLFPEVKAFILKKKCILHHKGTPGINKLGNIEIAIRTIRQLMRVKRASIKTPEQYLKLFRQCVKIYNSHPFGQRGLNGQNPEDFLKTGFQYPWQQVIPNENSLDYNKIKRIVDKKMKLIEKLFPINSTVRIKVPYIKFKKKTDFSTWSESIYFVENFRRPVSDEVFTCAATHFYFFRLDRPMT